MISVCVQALEAEKILEEEYQDDSPLINPEVEHEARFDRDMIARMEAGCVCILLCV